MKSIGIVCTSPGFGGLELNTLKLARALKQAGWQVRLLVDEAGPMYREAPDYISDIHTTQQFGGKHKATPVLLKRWLKGHPVAILFTPFNKDIKALAGYKRFRNRKVKLVYQQQMKVGVPKRDIIHRLRYAMLDLWISPLPYLKEETIRFTHMPERKIAIIPLGVDAGAILYTPATVETSGDKSALYAGVTRDTAPVDKIGTFVHSTLNMASARDMLQIPQDVRLMGVMGRIDPKKGQDFVIRALAHLHKAFNRNDHLLLMGNITLNEGNAYHDLLHRLVKENGLEDHVHFRPYHPDVNLCYQSVNIFIMPSLGETFGMVTLEAMLSGKPVIGVNRDGTAALLQQGRLGLLYEPEDIDGFCRQLFFAETSADIPDMLQRAREEVLAHYKLKHVTAETDRLLTSLFRAGA